MSNVYLHEVIDKWFHETILKHIIGKAFEVRYADDVMLCFENKEDAVRAMEVLPKRLAKYGLEMHPEKTKLICFKRPSGDDNSYKRGNRPDAFNFLGFTHYWKKSRKGRPVIGRKTARIRFGRALKKVAEWCKKNRHIKIAEQYKMLCLKINGHYGYYGITGNYRCVSSFRLFVERIWKKWLQRRSRKRNLYWYGMKKILKRFPLPRPRIVHSYV